jgi:DNA polymerase III epsilon subunit-like protein
LPDFKAHVATIAEAIEGAVIVGHNVERFDWPFLRNEFTRAGVAMPRPLAIIDTLRIARKLRVPPRHQLGVLCQRFDISLENAHTAGADAAATLLLLHRMMAAHPQHFRRPVEDIPDWLSATRTSDRGADRLGPGLADLEPVPGSHGWLCHTESGVVIVRGRNRGRSIAEIDRDDASYLDWLASPAGPLEAEALKVLTAERA